MVKEDAAFEVEVREAVAGQLPKLGVTADCVFQGKTYPAKNHGADVSVDLAIEDILALTPGSVISFGVRADDGVTLFAENTRLARAQPGSNGPRRAVQVCGPDGGVA